MKPAPFAYERARTVDDAVAALARDPDAKVLAGGQSLVPMMNMRLARPSRLVDINGIAELAGVATQAGGGLVLGALVRHTELATSSLVRARAPLLAAAAAHVGHRAIRNRGTLGGSVAHADPAAELPAALLALDATFVVAGPSGRRRFAADAFFVGLLATELAHDELLVAVEIPPAPPGWGFAELARRAGDFAIAGVAGVLDADGRARLAAFGVDDRPIRLRAAESALAAGVDAAAAAAATDCHPADDVHASSAYRRHLVTVLTETVIHDARGRVAAAQQRT
ncbi:MAG TPA: FAD binding domain-containing protein [Terriglobales bacterium]|nr:FAD binding domain-containing protein [Terriglobales bacterium]